MNIAAVMAAMNVDDVGRSAKHALIVVACRADRYTGIANVPVRRVAQDMAVHYNTARTALNKLVKTGYLTVDKSPGVPSMWMLTSRVVVKVPSQSGDTTFTTTVKDLHNPPRGKESLEKSKESSPLSLARGASGDAGEKPAPRHTTVDAKGYLYVVEDQ